MNFCYITNLMFDYLNSAIKVNNQTPSRHDFRFLHDSITLFNLSNPSKYFTASF
jgi:hypothetical protein